MARYLVTPALPYANGPIHLGHLVEHVQVNIFVRALRMAGEDVLAVCGADAHGTPIELKALEKGIAPEALAEQWRAAHDASFRRFDIAFDGGFGSTHTPENEKHAGRIYAALQKRGRIKRRAVEQLFDPEAGRFLPDRFVKGTCPKCGAEEQYGDSCEECGATYSPADLKDPRSVISGAVPVLKKSEHLFVDLAAFEAELREWTKAPGRVPAEVQNYLKRWFDDGLKDWDISRDGPYFGFPIPGEDDKFFYVWLDAPIGYQSMTERAAKLRGRSFEDYWKRDDTRIVHFIGKDIVYFHTLFWPALLMAAGDTLPERVAVHGMLTVDGVKMSKSRGTFILADDFHDALGDIGAQALRYYFACKLTGGVDDIDLSFEDFVGRVNADLVNKVVNLLSRSVPLLHRYADGKVAPLDADGEALLEQVQAIGAPVEGHYRALNFGQAMRDVVRMADEGNRYLQEQKPWDLAKTDPDRAAAVLSCALHVGKACVALLGPVLPKVAQRAATMLGVDGGFTFENAFARLAPGAPIAPYERLFERLDLKKVKALVASPAEEKAPKKSASKKPKASQKRPAGETKKSAAQKGDGVIQIDDFMQIELRAAKVLAAGDVEGADKLIRVQLDVGPLGERQVFAGLKPHVAPSDLLGKTVVLVANLKPRKMRFGLSEGMILAAGDDVPTPIFAEGATPGDRVR